MTTFVVTRHSGALDWLRRFGISEARVVDQLDLEAVKAGDEVVGTLPVHLAALVVSRGARYWHLSMELSRDARGKELSADAIESFNARLEQFTVERVDSTPDFFDSHTQ